MRNKQLNFTMDDDMIRELARLAAKWSVGDKRFKSPSQHVHWVIVILGACSGLHSKVMQEIFILYCKHHGYDSFNHGVYAVELAQVHQPEHITSMQPPDPPRLGDNGPTTETEWHKWLNDLTDHCIQCNDTGSVQLFHSTWTKVKRTIEEVAGLVRLKKKTGYCNKPHMIYFVTHYILAVCKYGVKDFAGAPDTSVQANLVRMCNQWIKVLIKEPERNLELLCELFTSLLCLNEPHDFTCDFAMWIMSRHRDGGEKSRAGLGIVGGAYMHHIPGVPKAYEHLHTLFVVLLFICKCTNWYNPGRLP